MIDHSRQCTHLLQGLLQGSTDSCQCQAVSTVALKQVGVLSWLSIMSQSQCCIQKVVHKSAKKVEFVRLPTTQYLDTCS